MNPTHATSAAYNRGCRCAPCRAANAAYQRERRTGGPRLIDAAPVRAHLLRLRLEHVGLRSVSAACDVDRRVLFEIASARRTKMQARIAAKVLAVDAQAIADGADVSPLTAHGMVRELLEEGFTREGLRKRLEVGWTTVDALSRGDHAIHAATELKVRRLYAALGAEGEAMPGDERPCGAEDLVIEGTREGMSAEVLAELAGITERTVVRLRKKHGLSRFAEAA